MIAHRRAIDDWLPIKWKMQQLWMETRGEDGIPGMRFPRAGRAGPCRSYLSLFALRVRIDTQIERGRENDLLTLWRVALQNAWYQEMTTLGKMIGKWGK